MKFNWVNEEKRGTVCRDDLFNIFMVFCPAAKNRELHFSARNKRYALIIDGAVRKHRVIAPYRVFERVARSLACFRDEFTVFCPAAKNRDKLQSTVS